MHIRREQNKLKENDTWSQLRHVRHNKEMERQRFSSSDVLHSRSLFLVTIKNQEVEWRNGRELTELSSFSEIFRFKITRAIYLSSF